MSDTPRLLTRPGAWLCKSRGSAGFSLAEALVAIVIAAILAVALTRVANNTRMNAGKIQELVNMMSLNNALLAQLAPKEAGTTHGRTARLSWQVGVAPLNFTAIPGRMNSDAPDGNANGRKVAGLTPISDGAAQTKKQEPPKVKWVPVYVTVAVDSPSGRRYSVDTISMAPVPTESAQAR